MWREKKSLKSVVKRRKAEEVATCVPAPLLGSRRPIFFCVSRQTFWKGNEERGNIFFYLKNEWKKPETHAGSVRARTAHASQRVPAACLHLLNSAKHWLHSSASWTNSRVPFARMALWMLCTVNSIAVCSDATADML